MQDQYNPQEIEPAVQKMWADNKSFEVTEDPDKEKFYCLSMFPYPSGKLHMGHVRNYTIGDVISRFQRMQGKNVLQPMGWDAFGLPAENAAIKNNVPPAQWTDANISEMGEQLKTMGFAYDWSRELATCKPDYYRWEQWFFLRLLEKGLVYRKKATVNWDPIDQTVLANEQVIDGRGWRSGAIVEQREIDQWFLKITAYADELLDDVRKLENWPAQVRTMQENWIGRSEGVELAFGLENSKEEMEVFTTRPDTLMGVTYLAVAPQHPLAARAAVENPELSTFIEECKNLKTTEAEMATMEKKGFATGLNAIHPITGESVPIWVANFVLMSYGSGAVMSVPAHDERDWAFAKSYDLPITQVITSAKKAAADKINIEEGAYTEKGILINSYEFNGLTSDEAFNRIADFLKEHEKGRKTINYRLRDWGVSRQRYWGCPIPIIYCDDCGAVAVPDEDLPVVLPTNIEFDESGSSPIKNMPEFYETSCPKCGKDARRETDTFDTFFESSWYFARYTGPNNDKSMLDERADYWLPVDQYVGGIEHAVLHLLYARFFNKLMRDEGLIECDEPFTNLLTQGMVLAETYFIEEDGLKHWVAPADVTIERDDKGKVLNVTDQQGNEVQAAGMSKMSKSKSNGVDPQALIEAYGADTLRVFSMFAAPPDQSMEWSDAGVEGANRFIKRLWKQVFNHVESCHDTKLNKKDLTDKQQNIRRKLYSTLQKVSDDMSRRFTFNTAIAANMELINDLSKFHDNSSQSQAVRQEILEHIVLMLSPIMPHVCQTLWVYLGKEGAVMDQSWPEIDESAMVQSKVQMMIQVNGKLRGKVDVSVDADDAQVESLAMENENIKQLLETVTVRKVIVVKGRLINIVAN